MTNKQFNELVKKHLGNDAKSVLLHSNPHSNQFAIVLKIQGAVAVVRVANDDYTMFEVSSIGGDLSGEWFLRGLADLTAELKELGR